jgi:hypothetical protein
LLRDDFATRTRVRKARRDERAADARAEAVAGGELLTFSVVE